MPTSVGSVSPSHASSFSFATTSPNYGTGTVISDGVSSSTNQEVFDSFTSTVQTFTAYAMDHVIDLGAVDPSSAHSELSGSVSVAVAVCVPPAVARCPESV